MNTKSKIETVTQTDGDTNYKRGLLDVAIPGVNRLFVMAFPNDPARNTHRKYFLPSLNINDYNVLVDGRNFYTQDAQALTVLEIEKETNFEFSKGTVKVY